MVCRGTTKAPTKMAKWYSFQWRIFQKFFFKKYSTKSKKSRYFLTAPHIGHYSGMCGYSVEYVQCFANVVLKHLFLLKYLYMLLLFFCVQ